MSLAETKIKPKLKLVMWTKLNIKGKVKYHQPAADEREKVNCGIDTVQ